MCALYAHAYYSHMCMSADDARWRICADNAHLMRLRAFCVYYARMRTLRRPCADAHSGHVRMCGAAQRAHRRTLRICACAVLRSMRRGRSPSREGPKCIIFLPILERESKSRENQCFSISCEGNFCSMTCAKCAPATRFRRTQQKFSRPRA